MIDRLGNVAKAFAACIALSSSSAGAVNAADVLKEYGVQVDKPESITVAKDQKMKGETKSQHLIELQLPGEEHVMIKIVQPIEPAAAAGVVEAEQNTLKKVFAAAQTPYMGDIAQAIGGCPPRFGPMKMPMQVLGVKVDALLGAVKPDFAFGACDEKAAKYKGALIAYYDSASKAVWVWRAYTPWKDQKSKLSGDWLASLMKRFHK